MPINQQAINDLLARCEDANNNGVKVYFCDDGNLMTAINSFRRITGQDFNFSTAVTTAGGFKLQNYQETINGAQVGVNLRGGSSSSVTTERYTMTAPGDKGLTVSTHDVNGVPTIDIINPAALTLVPAFMGLATRVEIKFTTRSEFVSAKPYYVSG